VHIPRVSDEGGEVNFRLRTVGANRLQNDRYECIKPRCATVRIKGRPRRGEPQLKLEALTTIETLAVERPGVHDTALVMPMALKARISGIMVATGCRVVALGCQCPVDEGA
jgi:hypothetical protein